MRTMATSIIKLLKLIAFIIVFCPVVISLCGDVYAVAVYCVFGGVAFEDIIRLGDENE